ncbi:MAG: hypothetical protein LLG04_16715 [Parachlamydia sp.]|nr:hypothetical protein [Parachlamydia sp.]
MTTLSQLIYGQYRTLNHTYLFKSKSEQNLQILVIKVYDISRNCVFKTSFSPAQIELLDVKLTQTLEPDNISALVEKVIQKKLIPADQFHSPEPTIQGCIQEIRQIVSQIKLRVLFASLELEKFTDPITFEVFKEPVIDEHGHTFEKSSIEGKACPFTRGPITSLVPNRIVKQAIEEYQRQEPIPTFSLYKKENKQLADKNLQMVSDYLNANEFEDALDCYVKAFQYTKEWRNYVGLPLLFEKMGNMEKACLAYLHLAEYQLNDAKVEEAIKVIEHCQKNVAEMEHINSVLVKLYQITHQTSKAASLAFDAADKLKDKHPKEAFALYQQVVMYDPNQWKAYLELASLANHSFEKTHILLTGACHALRKKDYSRVAEFCDLARSLDMASFVDRLVEIALCHKTGLSLKEKLTALAHRYDAMRLQSQKVLVYKMLARLEYAPEYYEKIIQGYSILNRPEKILSWTLIWLSILIENKEWSKAEDAAEYALKRVERKLPLYERLESVYTHWQNHKLNALWLSMGGSYLLNGQVVEAEKTYRKACDRFQSFDHFTALAETLIMQDKQAEGVQAYYRASLTVPLNGPLDQLNLCLKNIRLYDPEMQCVDASQRRQIQTMMKVVEMADELNNAKEKLSKARSELNVSNLKLASTEIQLSQANNNVVEWKDKFTSIGGKISHFSTPILPMSLGKEKLTMHLGDIGFEPFLPQDIYQRLEGPCPIWEGKKIKDTHYLVLHTQAFNGRTFTIDLLRELTTSPRKGTPIKFASSDPKPISGPVPNYTPCIFESYREFPENCRIFALNTYWYLITKDVIPGTRNISYGQQKALVELRKYCVPTVLEVALASTMTFLVFGERILGPGTRTRCLEMKDSLRHYDVCSNDRNELCVGYTTPPHVKFKAHVDYDVSIGMMGVIRLGGL